MFGRRRFLTGCLCCAAGAFTARAAAEVVAEAPPLSVTQAADGVWVHTSWKLLPNGRPFPSNGLIVKGAIRTVVIDTSWPTEEMNDLLDRAEAIADGTALSIAVTHAHDDRMSGLDIARERGVSSTAFLLTQEYASIRRLPLADNVWTGRTARLQLGAQGARGRLVELFYPGPAHSADNVVAFDEESGVLFGGCMVRAASGTALGNVADADVPAWPAAMGRVIARYGERVRLVVPGHGDAGGPELLTHTLALAEAAAGQPSQ